MLIAGPKAGDLRVESTVPRRYWIEFYERWVFFKRHIGAQLALNSHFDCISFGWVLISQFWAIADLGGWDLKSREYASLPRTHWISLMMAHSQVAYRQTDSRLSCRLPFIWVRTDLIIMTDYSPTRSRSESRQHTSPPGTTEFHWQ